MWYEREGGRGGGAAAERIDRAILPPLTLHPTPPPPHRGEHMHHGLYRPNDPPKSNQQAQIDMIDAVLAWAGVERVSKV